eukprot:jgi/Undpi1/4927/HiC_scaffold_19.g08279.m1
MYTPTGARTRDLGFIRAALYQRSSGSLTTRNASIVTIWITTDQQRPLYGLPSTHTMGSLIPLFLVMSHHYRHGMEDVAEEIQEGSPLLLLSSLAWSAVIAISRLYMGVHSIPDIVAGYILGGGLLAFWLNFGNTADAFIVENSRSWLAVLAGASALILAYPRPERWTNSYGDTALIVSTAAGFLLGCCLMHAGGRGEGSTAALQARCYLCCVHLLTSGRSIGYGWNALSGDARRCAVGFIVLLPMRFALRSSCRGLLSSMLARSPGWPTTEASRRHAVDIPYKAVVYGCMGFSSCFLVPRLWLWLGLEVDG